MLSPSDLPRHVGMQVTVAGRALGHEFGLATTSMVLADAFGQCVVSFATTPSPGSSPAQELLGQWVAVHGVCRATSADSPPMVDEAQVVFSAEPGTAELTLFARFAGGVGCNLVRRAQGLRAVRRFFDQAGYVEVSTPARVTAPGTDVYLQPQSSGEKWLITSPEFHLKRLVVGGLPRVYELARCHRRDEAGLWHEPEFTMLEWYEVFLGFDALLEQTESLVRSVAEQLNVGNALTVSGQAIALDRPFARYHVSEAFRRFAAIDDVVTLARDDEDRYFQLWVDCIEPALSAFDVPVFLTHYPLSQAALAQQSPRYPGFAERFELFIGGVELCNGYGELTCATTQRQRFEEDLRRRAQRRLQALPIDHGLLNALDQGLPPCSGNALGFDRLLAILLGEPLERLIAFPQPR